MPLSSVLGSQIDMHEFNELVQRSTAFSLSALCVAQQRTVDAIQASTGTTLVKTLQMVQLQKSISAVGMFSMFDAILQDQLQCKDGFKKADKILGSKGDLVLKENFSNLQLAVNVLKHGKGRSYDALVEKSSNLPFRVKLPGELFFNEGDVSEISTLVQVDDAFVLLCAEVIYAVSAAVQGNT